jgi:hypothetical protein
MEDVKINAFHVVDQEFAVIYRYVIYAKSVRAALCAFIHDAKICA